MRNEIVPREVINLIKEEELMLLKELQIKIRELNSKTNLTRLIEGDDYWISQVFDSIWPFTMLPDTNLKNKKFLDIGTGCGFPGFAYAITHPNSEIYLIDSSKKKTNALETLIKKINFKNKFFVINDRIENLAHQSLLRNSFNIVTARAVSNPSTVSEYILPMLQKNGLGVIYCGKWDYKKNKSLENTLTILKGRLINTKEIFLPRNKGVRNIFFIQPEQPCPDIYPRGIGKPEKYPLGD